MLHHNFRPHIAKTTLQEVTDIRYKIFKQPSNSPDLSFIDKYFRKTLDSCLHQQAFRFKGEIENTFKDLLVSKLLAFYHTGINNLVNR